MNEIDRVRRSNGDVNDTDRSCEMGGLQVAGGSAGGPAGIRGVGVQGPVTTQDIREGTTEVNRVRYGPKVWSSKRLLWLLCSQRAHNSGS